MASFFNLKLDTTAPSGLTLVINGGAQYTTTTAVSLAIAITDTDKAGYQMKIWGTTAAANEAAATWETFADSKNITLPSGDGVKTVFIRVRDNVGNATGVTTDSITLDTAVPAVSITGPDVTVISKTTSYDTCAFSFSSDVEFVEYKVKVVPTNNSLNDAGTLIPTTCGSVNMAGTGEYEAAKAINCTIMGVDLDDASSGDGTKIVKVFVKTASGNWSVA